MTLPTPYQQVWAVAILACITGALGSVFTEFNTWVCLVRKKWAKSIWLKIAEVREPGSEWQRLVWPQQSISSCNS
jgi:chloride channel 7